MHNLQALERYTKAITVDARRYAAPDSPLNRELPPGLADQMLTHLVDRLWTEALDPLGCRLVSAGLTGALT